jgi:hypothetical protein
VCRAAYGDRLERCGRLVKHQGPLHNPVLILAKQWANLNEPNGRYVLLLVHVLSWNQSGGILQLIIHNVLSAFAEDHGRKPMDECDSQTLRSSKSEGGCFGGFRRRKEGYYECKPVKASLVYVFSREFSETRKTLG